MGRVNGGDLKETEVDLALEAIYRRYGYDFRQYARPTVTRRLSKRAVDEGFHHIADLIPGLLRDESLFERVLADLSISVTEVFRDPAFFAAFRRIVVPYLKTFPFLKIWHAGCSTGEEAYSTAILFEEEGYCERTAIYATDINTKALEQARRGDLQNDRLSLYQSNYKEAGSTRNFADYYCFSNGRARFHNRLAHRITFAHHNLAIDKVFAEFNAIVCRNVLIYFDWDLQERVINLFRESLCHGGILCLGPKESINAPLLSNCFEKLSPEDRIYRRVK